MLDKIVFKAEQSTAANQAYVNGEIDYDFDVAVDPADYKQVKSASGGHVTLAAGPDYRQFTFNGTHGFMTDQKVRQAIMLGTNRIALIKSDLTGIPWPDIPLGNHFYMNSQAGYQDNTGDLGTYDAGKAKQMLEADGFKMNGDFYAKGGKPLEISFTIPAGIASSKNEGELFQAMMKVIGVKVDIKTVPSDDFFDKYVIPGNIDVTPFSWLGTPFPISSSLSIYKSPKAGGGQNFTGIANPQVDKLLNQAVSETDQAKAQRARAAGRQAAVPGGPHRDAVPASADVRCEERPGQPGLVRLRVDRLHQDRLHEVTTASPLYREARPGHRPGLVAFCVVCA